MRVLVINLDRDTDRWAEFLRMNTSLPDAVRYPAVDGSALDRDQLRADGLISPECSWTAGGLGSAMSHVSIWKHVVETGEPITIMEDDAILARNFVSGSNRILESLRDDWGIVLWGWNFDAYLWVEIPEGVSTCRMEFLQHELRANIDVFRQSDYSSAPVRLRHAFGIMAYSISPAGAELMLKTCLPLTDRSVTFSCWDVVTRGSTIDFPMNEAYPVMPAYACVPPLAASKNIHEDSRTLA